MLMSPSTATLLGVIGMALLAISWFGRNKSTIRIAQVGWVLLDCISSMIHLDI